MRKKNALLILFLSVHSLFLFSQQQRFKGYPEENPDIRSGFVNPPKGYGNVPFYWWSGDKLDKERLGEQLDILSQSATDGFAVSYIHTDPEVDIRYSIKAGMAFTEEQVRAVRVYFRKNGGTCGTGSPANVHGGIWGQVWMIIP